MPAAPRVLSLLLLTCVTVFAQPKITLEPGPKDVPVYGTAEYTVRATPGLRNCFEPELLVATFTPPQGVAKAVAGFCDSEDGTVFRLRFLPKVAGEYQVSLVLNGHKMQAQFRATASNHPGMVQVDPKYPWHFVYSGSGQHYFYNSTTAYWLLGFQKNHLIAESLDRLASHKVNRIRVALNGRTKSGARWMEEAIQPSEDFQFRLEPWPAARPTNIENPGYDTTRFNLAHFRKVEMMLREAGRRGIVVSLIFHLDGRDPGVDPFGRPDAKKVRLNDPALLPAEQRYYRYALARLAAFPNVMWDATNEWHLFRDEGWVNSMGALIKRHDPYGHLATVHGNAIFPFRTSAWVDFAIYQSWDEHGSYEFIRKNREAQATAGRPMPQVNEEYGYEDHYPYPWGEKRNWPARIADNRRRIAWEISMAGGYQTTGERANVAGYGGWITGRGNARMTLLEWHRRMMEFFTAAEWWTAEPQNLNVLANPGKLYYVWSPEGKPVTLDLPAGTYVVKRYDPRLGNWGPPQTVKGGATWTSPEMPAAWTKPEYPGQPADDWAWLIRGK